MEIHVADSKRFVVSSNDKELLEDMQARMDGKKVYMKNQILIPFKSGPKIFRYSKYDIYFGEGVKDIIKNVVDNIKSRKHEIIKCRSEYGKFSDIDYEYKGIYDKPLLHQVVMFNVIMKTDAAALLADPGTCKTGPYLWAIDKRIQDGTIKKALIITLSPLKKNIIEEMKKQVPHLSGVVLNNKTQANNVLKKTYKVKKKNIDYDIYIANYESMYNIIDFINYDYFDMIILDEAHRIGAPASRQTKSIIKNFEHCKFKYIVTGTLNANNLMSFFMPFRFMGPDTVPYANFYEFRRRNMRTVDPDARIWVPNPGAKDLVKSIIGNLSVAFQKEECLDLPPIIYQNYKCQMHPDQNKLYKEMQNDLISIINEMCSKCNKKNKCDGSCEDEIVVKNALVLAGKLRQIALGFYMNTRIKMTDEGKRVNDTNIITLENNPKLKLLIQILNNIPPDKKVIIWSSYIHAIDMISNAISNAFGKDSFLTCYKSQDAFEQVDKFKSPSKRYIISNPVKMGVGLNIHFSNYQAFFNNSYSWIERNQAIARQHREGQVDKVTVIDIIMEKTIEEIIMKAVYGKRDLSFTLSQLARVLK